MADGKEHAGAAEEASRVPLLAPSPSHLHEGCPGCRLDHKKATSHGALPLQDLCIIALLTLTNALPISSLFSYVYFMVEDLGIAKSTTDIGIYVGFLGSVLLLGRFLTSTFWGMIADRYGHKIVIYIGTASTFIFILLFGFSTNYWIALMSRFLMGVGNGMAATIRAYAYEVCGQKYQATSLSVVGTMWGVGLIIGPAVGGYLAQPSEKFPAIFPSGSLFDRFPYALPSVCLSLIPLMGFVSCIWLPESRHNHSKITRKSGTEIHDKASEVRSDIGPRTSVDALVEGDLVQQDKSQGQDVKKQLWKNWGLGAAITVNALWVLHAMAFSEIFPLWAVSPGGYGGLDFTTSEVANVLALSGAALLILQLFLFPPLAKTFGIIQVMRLSMFLTIPVTATLPLISTLQGAALWGVLLPMSAFKNILSGCNFTGSFLLVNNAVVNAERGVANGVSTSIMSAFQAIGPACAGAIFTWAETRSHAFFLPGMWMVFSIMSALSFLAFLTTFEPFLPASLNNPAPES